jgi:putative membrane protein
VGLILAIVGNAFGLWVTTQLVILSIPLLILSLGLFYFVLNGILLWVASWFLPGYRVDGIVAGIVGALVMTLVNWAVHAIRGKKKD